VSVKKKRRGGSTADRIFDGDETSLLDLLDDVLNKGVLVDGELVLGVADVDLIYLRLSTVLAAADRVLTYLADERKARPAPTRMRRKGPPPLGPPRRKR
jgi:hypothetical protein